MKLKRELEEKLESVSQSIGNLSVLDDIIKNKNKKPNLMDKAARKEFYENEKKKAQEIAEKVHKFSEDRKQTDNFIKIESEKFQRLIEENNELKHSQYLIELNEKEKKRKDELEKMKEKKEKRLKELEQLKKAQSEINLHLNSKPLFIKLEETFKNNVEMPELKKRKEELLKKRLKFSPIQHDRIKDHIKWYNDFRASEEAKIKRELANKNLESQMRSSSLVQNTWSLKWMEEEEKLKRIKEKKLRIEKMNKYSQLIKELSVPAAVHLHKKKIKKINEKNKSSSINENARSVSVWKPHKYPSNSMIPPPKQIREPKPILYLEELRRIRENNKPSETPEAKIEKRLEKELLSGSYTTQNLKKIHEEAFKLEDLAKKKELFLNENPKTISDIEKTATVDNIIITSIKAKLAIIESLS